MTKKNPLKLNALQSRTLVLLQELARHPRTSSRNEETGEVEISQLPHAHGDHLHVGSFVVSARDASGFYNEAVWVALQRKGLARAEFPFRITLTTSGLDYDTGLNNQFMEQSDH
jgi:hypothetical protein